VIDLLQSPLPDNTQHLQESDIQALDGIQTCYDYCYLLCIAIYYQLLL